MPLAVISFEIPDHEPRFCDRVPSHEEVIAFFNAIPGIVNSGDGHFRGFAVLFREEKRALVRAAIEKASKGHFGSNIQAFWAYAYEVPHRGDPKG